LPDVLNNLTFRGKLFTCAGGIGEVRILRVFNLNHCSRGDEIVIVAELSVAAPENGTKTCCEQVISSVNIVKTTIMVLNTRFSLFLSVIRKNKTTPADRRIISQFDRYADSL